jgi:3-deoxy-D-manno-octulosonate 8-phosphate phosphatase (KDO 8-P phosphatase)
MDRLKHIELVLLDVDGVLTAGDIIYSDNGEEIKIFNVKDGLGIRLLKEAGIQVGIVTGRRGKALQHRCQNLGIDLIIEGVWQKAGHWTPSANAPALHQSRWRLWETTCPIWPS